MRVDAPATPTPRRRSRAVPAAVASPSEQVVADIPVAEVFTGLNNRTVFHQAKLEDLAASMAEHGLAQPITVRPRPGGLPGWQLVAGERRWRAAKHLGWATIPALVRDLTDRQARSITLIENSHREDVDPIVARTLHLSEKESPMPTSLTPPLSAGDFVIIIQGQDDLADGQICRVLDRSEEPNYAPSDFPSGVDLGSYAPGDLVIVMCWTGHLIHTEFRNLVPVAVTDEGREKLAALFADGSHRADEMVSL